MPVTVADKPWAKFQRFPGEAQLLEFVDVVVVFLPDRPCPVGRTLERRLVLVTVDSFLLAYLYWQPVIFT
jgi:hypothetical protein